MAKLKVRYKETPYFLGLDMTKARKAAGLTQEEMAFRCCWSLSTQKRLEGSIAHILTEGVERIINEALSGS